MTLVSLAVQSARTCVFVGSDTVCFEIRGSVYQRGLRNFRSREHRVQREPTTEVISILTSKRTWTMRQIFILLWRTYSREIPERTDSWHICKCERRIYYTVSGWNACVIFELHALITFSKSGQSAGERDTLETNKQLCRVVWWYIICAICSPSCWMASCARASVQSTQRASPSWSHLAQLSSEFTLSQTAWEVWRLSWLSSDTTECGGSAALRNQLGLKQL